MSAFYITTAIEYANGEPHLGHAFEKIGADAIARYRRLRGDTVHLLVGSDDHGLKVARAAQAAGRTPGEQANQISAAFRRAWDALGIGYDRFVRTSTAEHAAGVRAIIGRILARHPDAFYEKAYEGWYCVGCESFRTPRELDNGRCAVHPSLDWGIPFPIADARGRHQTIYVWFDALPSYLTATGFPEAHAGAEWPAQVHVVGKDITRFHCVLWPAVLIAAGLPLPERVWAHGFVTANGVRLSKSAGAWIDLDEAIARYGVDALRYFLLREIPFDDDGDFTWQRFDSRYTADLANTLGNLTSRVAALVARHAPDGCVPQVQSDRGGAVADAIHATEARIALALEGYVTAFDAFLPHEALTAVFDALAAGNELISRTAPWALATDPARRDDFDRTIRASVTLLAQAAILLWPVIPATAERLWRSLGGPACVEAQRLADVGRLDPTGWRVTRIPPVFPRAR